MQNEKLILIDVDGVLTDGKVWYDQFGERTKGFHSRDIRSIRELVSYGFEVYLLTASSWPGLKYYADRTGACILVDREKACDQFNDFIAIGDDTADLKMLKKAKRAFCPLNACSTVKQLDKITILNTPGGDGVISELLPMLGLV
jgi:3-deoxy-D-manno-octulosonate 8-phosphate phosphatase (KDO 8-P phosphatase)